GFTLVVGRAAAVALGSEAMSIDSPPSATADVDAGALVTGVGVGAGFATTTGAELSCGFVPAIVTASATPPRAKSAAPPIANGSQVRLPGESTERAPAPVSAPPHAAAVAIFGVSV